MKLVVAAIYSSDDFSSAGVLKYENSGMAIEIFNADGRFADSTHFIFRQQFLIEVHKRFLHLHWLVCNAVRHFRPTFCKCRGGDDRPCEIALA